MAELDLRPVSSCIPAHIFFGFLTVEFVASLKKILFRLENQGFHLTSPNFIVIHIFFIVKFVSSFDGIKNVLIHPARLLTLFDLFLLSGACLSSKERNVSLKNCTAAEGSSYEFIFDQDC